MSRKPVRRAPGPSLRAVGEAGATGDDLDLCMAAVSGKGDRAAFGRLVQHFAPRLLGFFAQGGASRAEAEDFALNALAALWREAALYDSRRTTLGAFVFVIARNLRLERAAGAELACGEAGEVAPVSRPPGEEAVAFLPAPQEGGGSALKQAMARMRAALEGET